MSSLVFWRDFNNVSDSLLRDNKIPNEISLISHLLLLDGNEIKLKPNWVPDILHENDPSYLTYCMSPLEEASPLEVIEEIIEEGSQDEKYCTYLLTRFIFEHCNKPFKYTIFCCQICCVEWKVDINADLFLIYRLMLCHVREQRWQDFLCESCGLHPDGAIYADLMACEIKACRPRLYVWVWPLLLKAKK